MGENCHRALETIVNNGHTQGALAGPCQDIYKSCDRWKRENRCENMKDVTDFFDINCAVTCAMCTYQQSTGRFLRASSFRQL